MSSSSPSRPDFEILDLQGKDYHRWVSDVEIAFQSKGFPALLTDAAATTPFGDHAKAQALMYLRRHIHPTLKRQYLSVKDPKILWDTLQQRFNNVHDMLLPELTLKWEQIRFSDYDKVDKYNQDMISLQADLGTVGVIKTDKDLLEKTFNTFSMAYDVLGHQYKISVDEGRIRTFADLMAILAKKERHSEIRLNSSQRPVGTKPIPTPQAHYGKASKQKNKGRNAPYNSIRGRHQNAGNKVTRRSNTWRREGGEYAPPSGGGRTGHGPRLGPVPNPPRPHSNNRNAQFAPCYKCGSSKHYHRDCRASKEMLNAYKKYKKFLSEESNYAEDEMIEANYAHHVDSPKTQPQTLDVPDFD